MELSEWVIVISAIVGASGAAGILNALVAARREVRRESLDHRTIQVSHQVDLVGAADALVQTQSKVIADLRQEIELLRTSMKTLEDRFDRVLDDLNNEQELGRELAHELERYRFQVAQRDGRIAELEKIATDQGARIAALEEALRANNIDPDEINGEPI